MSTPVIFETLRDFVALTVGNPRRYSREQALLDHGRYWSAALVSPPWLVQGPKRNCYGNARRYALVRDDVFYVEGYALDRELGIPLEHAWLVDACGKVVDPTWDNPEDCDYFGIALQRAFILSHVDRTGGEAFLHPAVIRTNYGSASELARGVANIF